MRFWPGGSPLDQRFDVVIIGAGVVGCAIARELSKYELSVALVEKAADVAMGTSGRNSGVVHAGFNSKVGSLMARLCVPGCLRFEQFCRELGVPYRRSGKLVIGFDEQDVKALQKLKDDGDQNGCPDLEIIDRRRMLELEPNVGGIAALYSPWTAVMTPYLLTIALAENALSNGVSVFLNTEVTSISRLKDGMFRVRSRSGSTFDTAWVINSAGLYADKIARMVGIDDWRIYPCRGQYFIMDKRATHLINRPVYPVPRPEIGGLGVHLTTTIDGNILIGPSAEYIDSRDDYASTEHVMQQLYHEARQLLPLIERRDFIRDFSGIRPKLVGKAQGGFGDFVIEESAKVPEFINLVGIESPGFTASPIIAEMVVGMIRKKQTLSPNPDFNPIRKPSIKFSVLDEEHKAELVSREPEYGEIVCRCEGVTLKEVKDALNNPLGVKSVVGVKYRTRAMMGRCQGGYCFTRIVALLEHEHNIAPEKMCYSGPDSYLFSGRVK